MDNDIKSISEHLKVIAEMSCNGYFTAEVNRQELVNNVLDRLKQVVQGIEEYVLEGKKNYMSHRTVSYEQIERIYFE